MSEPQFTMTSFIHYIHILRKIVIIDPTYIPLEHKHLPLCLASMNNQPLKKKKKSPMNCFQYTRLAERGSHQQNQQYKGSELCKLNSALESIFFLSNTS